VDKKKVWFVASGLAALAGAAFLIRGGLFERKFEWLVKKPMADCTGREILQELLGHLQFDHDEAHAAEMLDTSTCIPCLLPYSTSQVLARADGGAPHVVRNVLATVRLLVISRHPISGSLCV
jgi:myosin-crossreactive antigen